MEMRKYLPDGWDELTLPQSRSSRHLIESKPKSLKEIGQITAFIIAEEILSKSATNAWRYKLPDDQNDLDETVSHAPIEERNDNIIETNPAIEEKNDASIQKPTCRAETSGSSDEMTVSCDENFDPNVLPEDSGVEPENDREVTQQESVDNLGASTPVKDNLDLNEPLKDAGGKSHKTNRLRRLAM